MFDAQVRTWLFWHRMLKLGVGPLFKNPMHAPKLGLEALDWVDIETRRRDNEAEHAAIESRRMDETPQIRSAKIRTVR